MNGNDQAEIVAMGYYKSVRKANLSAYQRHGEAVRTSKTVRRSSTGKKSSQKKAKRAQEYVRKARPRADKPHQVYTVRDDGKRVWSPVRSNQVGMPSDISHAGKPSNPGLRTGGKPRTPGNHWEGVK